MTQGISVSARDVTTSRPSRNNINIGAQLTPIVQRLYSLFIWDLNLAEVVANGTLDPSGTRATAEYFFNVPPKVHEFSEPFTTRVVATQNGGKYIESHGSIFKDIRLQGTTGLRPRKTAPSTIPLLPTDSFQTLLGGGFTNQAIEVPKDEVTGFDDIHFLRNIFRFYSDLKSSGRKAVMIWRNIKDDDYWVVEPREFKLVQNSKAPLTYEYQISLQGLSKFKGTGPKIPPDPLAAMRSVNRLTARVQEYQQALLSSFMVVSTNLSRVQGAGYFAVNNILNPLTATIRGLSAITSTKNQAHKGLIQAATEGVSKFKEAAEQLSATLEVSRRDPLVRELRRAIITFSKILVEPLFRDTVAKAENERRARALNAYTRRGNITSSATSGRSGGSPTISSGGTTAVAEDSVRVGERIQDLARRLLGDARRWRDLVILNGLRSPYTSDDPGSLLGVLKPGDPILYPSSNTGTSVNPLSIGLTNPSSSETGNALQQFNGLLSQTYGRDIRLKSVPVGNDIDVTDFAVNQRGDLSTIVGVSNVEQAIKIKFSTEQGTLPCHPYFGAKFNIGSKADIVSFNTFRLNTVSTLLTDDRIADIVKLEFVAVGDVLTVSTNLLLVDAREYLTTNFSLRRF